MYITVIPASSSDLAQVRGSQLSCANFEGGKGAALSPGDPQSGIRVQSGTWQIAALQAQLKLGRFSELPLIAPLQTPPPHLIGSPSFLQSNKRPPSLGLNSISPFSRNQHLPTPRTLPLPRAVG